MSAVSSRPWWSKDTVVVVTGGNTGIGLAMVRQFAKHGLTVVLTARDPVKGQAAVDMLKAEGLDSILFHPLELCSPESAEQLAFWLDTQFGGIDILMNNAGAAAYPVNYENAKLTMETNYFGVKRVTKALLPLLRASPAGARIVNTSSRAGMYMRLPGESLKAIFRDVDNLSEEILDSLAIKYLEDVKKGQVVEEGWCKLPIHESPMYAESKLLMTTYSQLLAKELEGKHPDNNNNKVLIATFCPGSTKTAMLTFGIENGYILPESFKSHSADVGADTGVWLALLEKHLFPCGKFYANRTEIPLDVKPY